MSALSKREKILIGAAVVVALAIGVPGLVLFPASGTAARNPVAEAQRKHDQLMEEVVRTRGEMNQMQEEIDRHVSSGTPRDLVERMLSESQAAARTAGLSLADLKPAEPEELSGLRRVPVQVTLSAPFPKVVRFLYELERKDRHVQVDALRIRSGDAKSERLELELRLVGYVKGEEKPHAAGS